MSQFTEEIFGSPNESKSKHTAGIGLDPLIIDNKTSVYADFPRATDIMKEMFGVPTKKLSESPIPKDYIWNRGPEQSTLDGAAESKLPPPGYFNLNLAQGGEKIEGFINVNPSKVGEQDIVHKLDEYPYPFPDGSILNINIGSFICQLFHLDLFMVECYRLLVPNGVLQITAPYYTSSLYHSNIRNVVPITDDTFGYYCTRWLKARGIERKMKCEFEAENVTYFYGEEWLLKSDQVKDYARKHYWNVVEAVRLRLRAVK